MTMQIIYVHRPGYSWSYRLPSNQDAYRKYASADKPMKHLQAKYSKK